MKKGMPFSKEENSKANRVNLIEFAKSNGYILENRGRRAYHAKQSGGLYFFKDSNKYYHFSTDTSGGPIDFVMQFLNMDFKSRFLPFRNQLSCVLIFCSFSSDISKTHSHCILRLAIGDPCNRFLIESGSNPFSRYTVIAFSLHFPSPAPGKSRRNLRMIPIASCAQFKNSF